MKLIDQRVPVFFRRRRNATLILCGLIGLQAAAGATHCIAGLYVASAAVVAELVVVLFSKPVF